MDENFGIIGPENFHGQIHGALNEAENDMAGQNVSRLVVMVVKNFIELKMTFFEDP